MLGLKELGDAVGRRGGIVAADGYKQLDVVLLEERKVEILLEILVRGLETAHRQVRSALIEDVVGLEEVEILVTGIGVEKTRITVMQTDYAITFCKECLGDAGDDGIHARCRTSARENCNSLFHGVLFFM